MNRSRLVPVLLAAAMLLGAANLGAFAATGGPLLLGQSNTASKTTTVKTTGNGPALSLKSKKGTAPLKVSSATKVTKLNADLVDGQDSKALQTKSYVYSFTATGVTDPYVSFALPGLPPGKYAANFSMAAKVVGSPSLVGCFLIYGSGASTQISVAALGIENGSGDWFISGGGYVDTTTVTHRFACQNQGGTSLSLPANAIFPARLVLTRVDEATTAATTGVGGTLPRQAPVG